MNTKMEEMLSSGFKKVGENVGSYIDEMVEEFGGVKNPSAGKKIVSGFEKTGKAVGQYVDREVIDYKGSEQNVAGNGMKLYVGAMGALLLFVSSPILGPAATVYTIVKGSQLVKDLNCKSKPENKK